MKRYFLLIYILVFNYSCAKRDDAALDNVFYVKVEKVIRRDLKEEIVLYGSIKGKDEVNIYPRISGKIIKNLVKEGDYIKRNEPIALIMKDEVGSVYEPSPVPSTLTGWVGKVYLDEGADVTPMTPIALVVDQSIVRIQCDVPERYVSKVRIGQKVYINVDAYPNRKFLGKIDKITPILDKVSRTFLVETLFENQNNLLRSGMTAEVHIVLNEFRNVPSVSVSSLVYKDNVPYVYLVDRTKLEAKEIKAVIGFMDGDYVWVKNLKEGDEVINIGLEGIKDGSKIKIVE